MPKRQDGKETKMKLLNAACELFARDGYQETKVSDICDLAGANVASVNYYFGSKSKLYVETLKYLFSQTHFSTLAIEEHEIPEKRLKQFIHTVLKTCNDDRDSGYFSRLYMLEVVKPSGLLQDVWNEMIEPHRKVLHKILRDLLGEDADQETILLCEISLVTQIRVLSTVNQQTLEADFQCSIDDRFIAKLAEHISGFSLAGIKAIKKESAS